MPKILVYSTSWCPYCAAARALFKKKGADFEDVDIEATPEARERMLARAGGRRTVPQIFIGETHIGGFDDLAALDRRGGLDPLLG